jgi:hypothetical protein
MLRQCLHSRSSLSVSPIEGVTLDTVPGFVAHVLPRGQTLSPDEWQCQLIKFTTVIITFFHTHSSMMIRFTFSRGDPRKTAGSLESKPLFIVMFICNLHVIAARPSGKRDCW